MLASLVRLGNGIEVAGPRGTLHLDPSKDAPVSVTSHAHEDHLPRARKRVDEAVVEATMTAPTLDLLRLRRPNGRGRAVRYGEAFDAAGLSVTLRDAGHVLGSAMARVETPLGSVLYTGDFCPAAGRTSGRAAPEACDLLVTESTYGEPRFTLPPRELVVANLESWLLKHLFRGSVALGAHELGRAQDLVALLNAAGVVPVVSMEIGRHAAVYNAHGHDLAWAVLGSPKAEELKGSAAYVVPQSWLKREHAFVARLREENAKAALLSGWCQVFSYFGSYAIDAQFPLTDHATFPELLAFAEACRPKEVLTTHGREDALAREIERRLGIPARPLVAPRAAVPA